MHAIRKACLLTALHSLKTAEFMLDGLIYTRPYLPFALLSLIGGFAIGFLFLRF